MKREFIFTVLIAAFGTGDAVARKPATPPSQSLDALFACSSQTAPEARVTCYDTAVASLRQAVVKREVIVSDKTQIRETRRTLFGLALPRLAILGDGDGDDTLAQVESTLDRASTDNYGHFTFVLADGATWRQIDDNIIVREPRKGDAVVVKRAALGSFKLSVRGQPAVRVHRQN